MRSTRSTAERAARHWHNCQLCEHRCGVDRAAGERGFCKATTTARVFRHRVEYGEELELIPSHLFYLSGCDMRCAFCIAESQAFDPQQGTPLCGSWLRQAIDWARPQHPKTMQWVGGEPTIHLPGILQAMSECDDLPAIVWKSDFFCTPEALALLAGIVEVYVADFKFGNDDCAKRMAGVDGYVDTVTRNLRAAALQGDLIVRHLMLPGHFDCCYMPIVDWLSEHLPTAKFSLREGYLPRWRAQQFDELRHLVAPEAAQRARQRAHELRLQVIA